MTIQLVKADWTISEPVSPIYSVAVPAIPVNPSKVIPTKALFLDMSVYSGSDAVYVQELSGSAALAEIVSADYEMECWVYPLNVTANSVRTFIIGSRLLLGPGGKGVGYMFFVDRRTGIDVLGVQLVRMDTFSPISTIEVIAPWAAPLRVGLRLGVSDAVGGVNVYAEYNINGSGWTEHTVGGSIFLGDATLIGYVGSPTIALLSSPLGPSSAGNLLVDDLVIREHIPVPVPPVPSGPPDYTITFESGDGW